MTQTITMTVNGRPVTVEARAALDAGRRIARPTGADWHASGLRAWRLRCVYHPAG